MHRTIISDTSSLIIFQKIGELDTLHKVYRKLVTTPEIAQEYGDGLPHWIRVIPVSDKKYQEFLETQIDKGEASAIALAKEFEDSLLIIDDLKARKLAVKLNLKITGTLGIIHKAKQLGIIKNVKPLIDKILQTDFRISPKIIDEFLTISQENKNDE
jgi:predicted nucleic acid-binding protein